MWDTIEGTRKLVDKISGIVAFLRRSTTEQIAAFGAVFAFGGAAWLALARKPKQFGFVDEATWQKITGYGSLALYLLAGLLVVWIALRIWRRLTPPMPDPGDLLTTAIKGPMAFGPHDAELFSRLRREADSATLLNYILDDQIDLVIIYGESGAGKTSLLRAGLGSVLKSETPPIEYHYWEALPDESEKRLLAVIQDGWEPAPNGSSPQRLTDLFGPGAGPARRVIVLDQFEQLSPEQKSHRPVFQLLKYVVATARPPHRVTLIVAFRRDYAPTWLDFVHGELAGRGQLMMPLRLFTKEQAKEVMAVISQAARFTMDEALADDLVESMKNEEARVSPVDIGITLLALNERAQGKTNKHLNKGDYRIAGGATALLAEYISAQLDRYQPGERSTILMTLLELADRGKDHRLPEGRTPAQLAEHVPLSKAVVERYLKGLSSSQIRLLEELPSGAYRLPNERLIPALRQLSGIKLAEAEQADRTFNGAHSEWIAGQRRRALLLRGSRLRLVSRHLGQLNWAVDRESKEKFLRRSRRARNWRMAGVCGGVAVLSVFGYGLWSQFDSWQSKRDLASWRQPAELYDDQDHLTSLSITSSQLTHLRWLHQMR